MKSLFKRPEFVKANKAEPDLLLHAVAIQMARYEQERKQPGAEKWQSDTRRYRPTLVSDIMDEWARLAGTDEVFPWHDDYVLEVWVSFRKMVKPLKVQWFEYYGIPVPKSLVENGEAP